MAKQQNELAKQGHLEWLYEMHLRGATLPEDKLILLREQGYLHVNSPTYHAAAARERDKFKPLALDYSVKHENEIEADKYVDIVTGDQPDIVTEEQYKVQREQGEYLYEGGRKITSADWKPASILEHTKEFIEWVNSINSGFQNMKPYKPFLLYCQQAEQWLAENDDITQYHDVESRRDYRRREHKRNNENSLYFLNRYLKLLDGNLVSGDNDYDATLTHKVIAFLFDCGYSLMIGKGRQIAMTSTIGGLALKRMIYEKDYFIKYIAQDDRKVEEIFQQKIKYPFTQLPDMMKFAVANFAQDKFVIGESDKKGGYSEPNNSILVAPPSAGAINGGSPNLVLVDEAGFIKLLGNMLAEARPTMFRMDKVTKKLRMMRQLIVWGTGGEMDKGGKAYETEYSALMKSWQKKEFQSGIIPLFFDWTCRPGMTPEFYESEKQVYYSKVGPDAEVWKVKFHQHYPTTWEDMFLTSAKTLFSPLFINDNIKRIREIPHVHRAQYGFFEPIYDTTRPMPEGFDIPYAIIGAKFVPTDDTDGRATTIIFSHPKEGWKKRYYQGTDPIAHDNGLSKMSSSIWDARWNTIAAVMNYRDPNYKYVFLQSMLLGIYYDVEKKMNVKEVIEANLGMAYRQYKEDRGLNRTLVFNEELPEYLRSSGTLIGIDNRHARSKMIIDKMFEMIQAYGERICIEELFIQLKTFVCKITEGGRETWEPLDKKHNRDDILFSATFGYICRIAYSHLHPEHVNEIKEKKKVKYVNVYDKNFNLSRVPVVVKHQ